MKLTNEQQEKFDQASTQIFDYYNMAYGTNSLGVFMEAIEALIAYKDDDNEEYNEDLDLLITKFSTYLKGGES